MKTLHLQPATVLAAAATLTLAIAAAGVAQAGETFSRDGSANKFVSAIDFRPIYPTSTCPLEYYEHNFWISPCSGVYYASFELPEGARITFFYPSFYDNSASDIEFSIRRSYAPWSVGTAVGTEVLSTSVTNQQHVGYTFRSNPVNLTYDTYDHANARHYDYFVRVSMPAGTDTRLRGVWLLWQRQIAPTPAVATFNDVPVGAQFFGAIEQLAKSGITTGCGDGTNFCPNNVVTRGQMAAFLSRALGLHWDYSTNAN